MSCVCQNVRKIIDSRGLKYKAVAKKAGYSQNAFSNLINGRKMITDVDVELLCAALDVEPNDLFSTSKST